MRTRPGAYTWLERISIASNVIDVLQAWPKDQRLSEQNKGVSHIILTITSVEEVLVLSVSRGLSSQVAQVVSREQVPCQGTWERQ